VSGARRPRELFLSHANRDRRFTSRLADRLGRYDIRTWYSEAHVNVEAWHDAIGHALARCDWFAIGLTPAAVRSRWVKEELLYALRVTRYRNHGIPLLVKDCDADQLSWTLPSKQYVDFRGDFHAGVRDLLRRWNVRYTP
jgi:hypothetical protein